MEKTNGVMSLLGLTASAGIANLPNIGQAAKPVDDLSFSDTLKETSKVNSLNKPEATVAKTQTVVESNKKDSMKNIKNSDDISKQQNGKSLDDDEMKEISEEIATAVVEIKETIQNAFSKSDAEIEEAMETLSLTSPDLFDNANLRSLVMELTGTTDSIELITNTDLYDGLVEVSELADNLLTDIAEKFNISNGELEEIINTDSFENIMKQVSGETDVNAFDVENGILTNEEKGEEAVAVAILNTPEVKEDAKVATSTVINKDDADRTEKNPIDVTVEVEQPAKAVGTKPVSQSEMSQNENSSNEHSEKKHNLGEKTHVSEIGAQNSQVVTTQTVNTIGDIIETVTSYTSYADTENIMRQVTDYVRVNITEDVTKMEMQLHPASLGTVNMQINSQNGQVTAHLTVQNELVKSILESQMIKLQETFNEQGTKVTAIEVSVATYNLDAKSDNNYSQQDERNNRRAGGRRGINLNELSSFDELTDEEQLQAEVMEMNGSSVNYTA